MRSWFIPVLLLAMAGCVTVQGGDKPIKVEVTVTHKIDQQLDQFFAFEKKYEQPAATQPAPPSTQPTG